MQYLFAVNLLGSMRSTADLDILVEMSDENLKKLVTILLQEGYKVKQPIDPFNIVNKNTREDWINNKNLKALNFYKERELKEVDIIIDSPVSFEMAKDKVVLVKVDDLMLPVISIDHLIEMKKSAGRKVDVLDIEELEKVKKLRSENEI
ncbi:MAG: hypothetical protein Q8Q33_01020 [Chlamydiota bacterium]|nr:hypothetical protein [Chlamydiota bacterium]